MDLIIFKLQKKMAAKMQVIQIISNIYNYSCDKHGSPSFSNFYISFANSYHLPSCNFFESVLHAK